MKPETPKELRRFIDEALSMEGKAVVPFEEMLKIFNPDPYGNINGHIGEVAAQLAKQWMKDNDINYILSDLDVVIYPKK